MKAELEDSNIELSIAYLSDGVCWNGLCRSGMHQSCHRGVPTQLHHRVHCVKDSGVAIPGDHAVINTAAWGGGGALSGAICQISLGLLPVG